MTLRRVGKGVVLTVGVSDPVALVEHATLSQYVRRLLRPDLAVPSTTLGVAIVGPEASDLISESALALEMCAFAEDVALTVHPHPTLGEGVMEAFKHALGEAIHIMNRG